MNDDQARGLERTFSQEEYRESPLEDRYFMAFFVKCCFLMMFSFQSFAFTAMYLEGQGGYSFQNSITKGTSLNLKHTIKTPFRTGRLNIGYVHDFSDFFGFGFESGLGLFVETKGQDQGQSYRFYSHTMDFLFVCRFYWQSFEPFFKFGGNRNTFIYQKNQNFGERVDQQFEWIMGSAYRLDERFALLFSYLWARPATIKVELFPELPQYCSGFKAVLLGVQFTFF